jgi:DNA-3-methyladenine glycosylase II
MKKFPDADKAMLALAKVDKVLGRLMKKIGPMTWEQSRFESSFEALARSIVYQQLTGKAAATILGRVKAIYSETKFFTPHEILATSDEKLRSVGLSRAKAAALKDLSAKVLDGTVPESAVLKKMDDEAIIEHLIQVRGIGRWTVEMILIFHLGRKDVMPVGDYGVRKGFALTYGLKELPTPKELMKLTEKWKPYRTIASWYMWRAIDLAKEAKKPKA